MTVVNKFNVNREQVTLDADIIENMSANDVSYNSSLQYDENTVGDKLSELGQEVKKINNTSEKYNYFSLIGNGTVQQPLTMYYGEIPTSATKLSISRTSINVSVVPQNSPAVYVRFYNQEGEILYNQNITSEDATITIPDFAVKYAVILFATVVGQSEIGATYSLKIRMWFDNGVYAATRENLDKMNLFLGISSNETLTPTVIPGNYYINSEGKKVSAGSNQMRLTNPIHLEKNDAIFVRASTLNDAVYIISLTDENATKFEPKVRGFADNRKGNFVYVAVEDCYIVLNYYITLDKCIKVPEFSLLSSIPPIAEEQKYIKTNLDSVANLSLDSLNWLNVSETTLAKKATVSNMIKMAYFVPTHGYENHDIAILALSCYNNGSSETSTPTKLDLWLTDATDNDVTGQQNILKKYTKSIIEDSDLVGYKKVIITTTSGTAYILVNWGLVSQHKSGGKYQWVYWGVGWRNKPKLWNVNADDPRIIGFEENNTLIGKNMGVDGDSVTEGNQWSYYAIQKLGMSQFNVAVGSSCWSYKQCNALDKSTILTPQNYTDSDFAGFGGASDLSTNEKRQKWVNNNACTHIERFIAEVSAGNHPIPDVFIFAMGTNSDTGYGNSDGSVDEAMQAISISDTDFVNTDGKSLKYTMCGAMRWCIETIKRQYPNCRVFVSLPIQRASYSTNKTYLYPKIQLIKEMAIQMGCQIIDQYNGCGITAAIENDSSPYGPYLRDGLHPNTNGMKLMGAFAASQINAKYFHN